jgi:peptidoglycan/LPS O-acetylase OafA/YrhL
MSTFLATAQQTESHCTTLVSGRIPLLDGWRGIAILLVLFDHIQIALLGRHARPWTETGQHGVTIFFVLSGYLITSTLQKNGASIRQFYVRRFWRLMPAAWSYLAALLLFDHLFSLHSVTAAEILSCLFFYRNFLSSHLAVATGHFWSLSIEEQFYLIWPPTLLLLGPRRSRWIAAVGILACACYRMANWSYYNRLWFNFETQVRADALLVGCLLALSIDLKWFQKAVLSRSKYLAAPALAGLVYCISRFAALPPLAELLCVAVLITASIHNFDTIPFRWLNSGLLVQLGIFSYSIYLWQQFFFLQRAPHVTIVMICISPLFALGSYYFVERPCTRFGRRLSR